jgi:hypothetical protein
MQIIYHQVLILGHLIDYFPQFPIYHAPYYTPTPYDVYLYKANNEQKSHPSKKA